VTVFAFSREQIKVEIANEAVTFPLVVPHAEDLHVLVPDDIITFAGFRDFIAFFASYLHKRQSKELFKDL